MIADDSVTRDRRDKFDEYAAEGVTEYWMLDPRPGRRRARFYQVDADGIYREVSLGAEGRYHSKVLLGFWMRPDWLWQEPRPQIRLLLQLIAPDTFSPAS